MARLIIQIRTSPEQRKVNGNDLGRPQNYDLIVEATKALSIYKSPGIYVRPEDF